MKNPAWIAVAAVAALLGTAALTGCNNHDTKMTKVPASTASRAPRIGTGTSPVPMPTTKPTTKAAPAPTTKITSTEESEAILKAVDYLDGQMFSKKGLIEQLEFDGYPAKTAAAAVGTIKIDWNVEAAGKAKEYLDGQHFSKSGLIAQLEYDGFTKAQATYGANKEFS